MRFRKFCSIGLHTKQGLIPVSNTWFNGKVMALLTIAGSQAATSRATLLIRCQTTGTKSKLCKCKQLSRKMVLTLGWPLVIKFALPPTAEVVAEAVAEVESAEVVVEVSNLSASP